MKTLYPNRLQEYLAKRRMRRGFFFLSWIVVIACSTLIKPQQAGAVAYSATVFSDQSPWTAIDGSYSTQGDGSFSISIPNFSIPANAVVSSVQVHIHWRGTKRYAFHITNNAGTDQDAPSTPCSPTPASGVTFGTTTCTWTTGSNGFTYASTVANLNGNFDLRGIRFTGTSNTADIDAISVEVTADLPEVLNLYSVNLDLPGQPSTFRAYWENQYYGFDDSTIKHMYFFPYNQVTGCYTSLGDLCEEAVYSEVPGVSGTSATGSGALTFNYAYMKNGSFTGAILVSDSDTCDIHEIYINADCDDHIKIARKRFTIGSYESIPLTDSRIASTVFSNGGGSSGSYLATDKKTYYTGEPVYLKWRFDVGSLVQSQVRVYSGSGNVLAATFTSSGDLLENTMHAAAIFYPQPGEYQPFIRVCVGDCSTTFVNIYIGGGHTADFSKAITVISRPVSGGLEEGAPGASSPDDVLLECTNNGIFGLTSESFFVAFGDNSNLFYKGINGLINQGIDAAMWISRNTMCAFERSPLISNISDIIAPEEGTYTLPTSVLGLDIDRSRLFGQTTFVIDYSDDDETERLGTVISTTFLAVCVMWFTLNGIFGKRHG
jgi:hypothetical protein